MIELYESNPHKMTTAQEKKRYVYPGSLRQNQMFRPSETTEVSMEETHHHVLQIETHHHVLQFVNWVLFRCASCN